MLTSALRPSPMEESKTFKTRYLLGTSIGEKFFRGLIRPEVLLMTPNLKRNTHSFNIKKN